MSVASKSPSIRYRRNRIYQLATLALKEIEEMDRVASGNESLDPKRSDKPSKIDYDH